MLRHRFTTTLNLDLTLCLPCICDPKRFFEASPYTYEARSLGGDMYLVVFKWRKLGMTRYFPVKLRVERSLGKDSLDILYRSTHDSKYYFLMEIKLEQLGPHKLRVEAYTEMKAGLMADLLGRKEYRWFAEQLVRDGLFCAVEPPEETRAEEGM